MVIFLYVGDNLHVMSNPVFWGKSEKHFKMWPAKNFNQDAKCKHRFALYYMSL